MGNNAATSAAGMAITPSASPSTSLAREWLDPTTSLEHAEQIVLHQCEPSEAFEWFKVDKTVGNSRNQGAYLIKKSSETTP